MKRLAVLALVAIAGAGACGSGSSKSATSNTTTAPGWNADALNVADGLQTKLVAAKQTCTAYQSEDYAGMKAAYAQQNLPLPDAVTNCRGDGDEDLTTEVFADDSTKARFIDAKRKILCAATAKKKIDYPGFAYVDGGTWIFEPDDMRTAVAAQKVLGGAVKNADCKGL